MNTHYFYFTFIGLALIAPQLLNSTPQRGVHICSLLISDDFVRHMIREIGQKKQNYLENHSTQIIKNFLVSTFRK